jgi:hypothetical protein
MPALISRCYGCCERSPKCSGSRLEKFLADLWFTRHTGMATAPGRTINEVLAMWGRHLDQPDSATHTAGVSTRARRQFTSI